LSVADRGNSWWLKNGGVWLVSRISKRPSVLKFREDVFHEQPICYFWLRILPMSVREPIRSPPMAVGTEKPETFLQLIINRGGL